MPSRQTVLAVAVIAVPVVFLTGLIVGLTTDRAGKPPTQPWEIDPDFRREEVDGMFADYKAGRVLYTVHLPVLGRDLKVRMVNETRVTYEGFVPWDELGDRPTPFWYHKSGECSIQEYDSDTNATKIV
jgi:hypothetical protein